MDGNVINLRKIDEQIDRAYPDSEKKDIIRDTVHQCAYSGTSIEQIIRRFFVQLFHAFPFFLI